ncbi:MAG: 8-oxo-dGTP diphosphatase [Lachnospiraceae bacterium]|nr:8-oxo-dGTP diphosphatase [Lachnospiraceae bacterium]
MRNTTLIYIIKDGKYLMLNRAGKKHDLNEGKWIGVGGKVEEKETPERCAIREAYEETGLKLTDIRFRGIVYFISDEYESEFMFLYTSDRFSGEPKTESDEGILEWIDIDKVASLKIWEGDKLFLELLRKDAPLFEMELRYEGDKLVHSEWRYI